MIDGGTGYQGPRLGIHENGSGRTSLLSASSPQGSEIRRRRNSNTARHSLISSSTT